MNDCRIHRNMKIAWNDSVVKLGCCDQCGLPLNALERISEQALNCLLEWGTLTGDRHDELAAMDLSTIAVALTPS